jgi:hypothetical protein
LPLLGAAELQTDKPLPAVPLLCLLCRYAAIFKHAKDELGFCYYLIPCGKKAGQMGSCTVRCRWGRKGGGAGTGDCAGAGCALWNK